MSRKIFGLWFYIICFTRSSALSSHYLNRNEFQRLFNIENNDEYEIIFLPDILPKREAVNENGNDITEELVLEFNAFGRSVSLNLKENSNLLSPHFKTYVHNENKTIILPNVGKSCLFLHKSRDIVASINSCESKFVSGFVFLDDATLEITPIADVEYKAKIPYAIKKIPHSINTLRHDISSANQKAYTVEVGLFFDESAYNVFASYLSYDDEKIRDMLLAYLNGVQALYRHPTLGTTLDVVIVRMDILKKQPEDLLTYNAESSQLLDSFCLYQNNINAEEDSDPNHWDIGLYVSGLDFFTYDRKGYKDYGTMGLSTVGGVCHGKYSCVIAEFGSRSLLGKPYPTAGFTSVYVLAHEIGHNLGMHHDGTKNDCPTDGYIMSASRGTAGETQWSKCSAQVMQKLSKKICLQDYGSAQYNHSKFFETPGRLYTAKRQCEVFLADKDAYVADIQENVCQDLICKTPHKSVYYSAGPALDGTQCDVEKYCNAGDCVKTMSSLRSNIEDNSKMIDGRCQSGCIVSSKGYKILRGICNSMDGTCSESTTTTTVLCKDINVCSKRISVVDYMSQKCKYFSYILPELDPKGIGLQRAYEIDRSWLSCAIFCRKKDGAYYTPRIELEDMGLSPYLPDGTLCHKSNDEIFYCINGKCMRERTDLSEFKTDDNLLDLDINFSKMSVNEEWTLDQLFSENNI